MAKRIFLFILVNILVVITISITLNVLGVRPYLTRQGIDYKSLLIFCAVVGFTGAIISLLMSKYMAKTLLGVVVIDPNNPANRTEQFLIERIHRFAQDAGITSMPEVGIYESPEVNAFATGPTKNSALVAVSTGLLNTMNEDAVEGVLGHEIAHAANGDMVTMTLIQAIVNTFVMFFARIAAWAVASFMRGDDEDSPPSYFLMSLLTFLFEIFLSILGSIVVCYFSRIREYSADKGGANLAGTEKMIQALEELKATMELIDNAHQSVASLKISGHESRILRLFSTHPSLDDRIARLRGLPEE